MFEPKRVLKSLLLAGAAMCLLQPAPVWAQTRRPDLERRVQELEAALASLKAELEASKSQASAQAGAAQAKADEAAAKATAADAKITAAETRVATVEKKIPDKPADGFTVGATTFKISGFIKGEALLTRYGDGDTATNVLGRDFYLPSSIPVGASAAKEDADFDAHAKQTRIAISATTAVQGHKLGGYVEGDFQSAAGTQGSERTTNAYNFAMRRVYVTFDDWLFGQEWSTFMNTATLPETTDFIGPTEGTVFVREPQIRYTRKINDKSSFSIAAENPATSYVTTASATLVEPDDSSLPDFVARYNFKAGTGDFAVAGLVRQLSVDNGSISRDATGWGLMGSGKIMLGKKNDLRVAIAGGEGVGRFLGLNFSPDAILTATGLEPVNSIAGFASVRVYWTDKTRSNFTLSAQEVDAPSFAPGAMNKSAWSAAANIFTTPVKGFDLGLEYRHGERETVNGADGTLDRLHLVAKQSF
jgi:hypothetical protein